MGLLDFFRGSKKKTGLVYAPSMTGTPFFAPFGDNIYASDIIVQAVSRIATEAKKLQPRHIRTTNGQKQIITDSGISKCLRSPNVYMTTSEFLEKCWILLLLNKNVFVYHEHYYNGFGERITTGLYPLKPSTVDYCVDNAGKYFLRMTFENGYTADLPMESVTHYRKNYGVNDYFGGGIGGSNDDQALLKLIRQYDKLTQGIAKAMAISCNVNGLVKVNTYLTDEKQEYEQNKFRNKIENNESGILFIDQKTEYTNIPRDVKLVDADTLKFFNEAILRNFGVSIPILNGDYTPQQKQAFYETAMESDVIGFGQALSKTEFSEREISFGNEIILYPNKIDFMTPEQKVQYLNVAVPAGALKKNEIRDLFGFEPIEGGNELPRAYNSLDGSNQNNDETGENENVN